MLPVRGNDGLKEFELYLRGLLEEETPIYLEGTRISLPGPNFNALFLTAHAFTHFMLEGLGMRQICDWAMFLKAEQDKVDWDVFYQWMDDLGMSRFINSLNYICVEKLGLELTSNLIVCDGQYADRILNETLFSRSSVYNKGLSKWGTRLAVIRNYFSFGWKYHKICRKSMLVDLMKRVLGVVFDREPSI